MSGPRLRLMPPLQRIASLPVLVLSRPIPPVPLPPRPIRPTEETGVFARFLQAEGVIAPHAVVQALVLQAERSADLCTILRTHGFSRDPELTRARAKFHGLPTIDPAAHPPDIRLIDRLGAADCLRDGLLPWRRLGETTLIVAERPDHILRHRDRLEATFGQISTALAPRAAIDAALQSARGDSLRRTAETRTPAAQSCRNLGTSALSPAVAVATLAIGLAALMFPAAMFGFLTAIALLAMTLSMGQKGLALLATLCQPPDTLSPPPLIARLPTVSIIVALYRESDIAARLVRRLGQLDYPRDLLDVLFAVEEHDSLTRQALDRSDLPPWIRVIVVPDGPLKTKPRALNYALGFCRGSIIGVYDAEDAPESGQIRKVVDRFHQRDARVACLQGVLDFYNPTANWMARCFTFEYAAWFRLILPGLDRLGLPIPLGGTTLFFRRAALEALGAWDAHNVTEDADLGMRLYRHGYRTELIDSVTYEEANCHAIPWIKQRSRWIKGYMMTWRVHMRDPVRLWRQLGPRGFFSFQILFLGSLTEALLAPLLLSFWAVTLGVPHPVADLLGSTALHGMTALFLLCETLNLSISILAIRRTRHRINPVWVLALRLYHPLAGLAAYKALWEMLWRPFYWDKTGHGKRTAARSE